MLFGSYTLRCFRALRKQCLHLVMTSMCIRSVQTCLAARAPAYLFCLQKLQATACKVKQPSQQDKSAMCCKSSEHMLKRT